MDREEGAVHQKRTLKDPTRFVRENALVQEVNGDAVMTSKGEQFLQELLAIVGASNPDSAGAHR